LVFDASWLIELINKNPDFQDPVKGGPHSRLLRALGYGFLTASDPKNKIKSWLLIARWERGKKVVKVFQTEFSRIYKREDWKLATETWRHKEVSKKVQELTRKHPVLLPVSNKLADYLCHKRAHLAAVLVAHKLERVPIRKLEGRSRP